MWQTAKKASLLGLLANREVTFFGLWSISGFFWKAVPAEDFFWCWLSCAVIVVPCWSCLALVVLWFYFGPALVLVLPWSCLGLGLALVLPWSWFCLGPGPALVLCSLLLLLLIYSWCLRVCHFVCTTSLLWFYFIYIFSVFSGCSQIQGPIRGQLSGGWTLGFWSIFV